MAFDARLLSGIGTLVAVAEAGGFARAADTLGLTPSGVSRSMGRLEARLGVRLFERNARVTRLTEAGSRLLDDVGPLLGGIAEAATRAAGAAVVVKGRLRINCDPWFASRLLAPRLDGLLDAYPDLSLEVVVRHGLGDMVADGFDAAIRFGEPDATALVTRKLLDTRIVTCASPVYLARHGRPRHPRDLATAAHRCILFRDPATGRPYEWEFRRGRRVLPVKAQGRLTVNDPATGIAACVAGLGIAQPMELSLRDMLADGRLVDLFPDWNGERFPLHVYYPSRHLSPAKLRAFLDFLIQDVAAPDSRIQGTAGGASWSHSHTEDAIMATTKSLKAGDKVTWGTAQGETHGTVVKKETGTAKVKGHTAKASKDAPQYRVKSDKSGKEAIHKPQELKKA